MSGIPPAPRGVPQIEVTFDVNADGILTVSAQDKSTGKVNNITITNDKGRLSKEDIEKMVNEAEKYKDEDEINKKRIEAKNGFEGYLYGLKQSIEEDKVKDKLSEEELTTINTEINNSMSWLETHQNEDTETYENKKKQVEKTCSPIISKLYGSGSVGQEPAHENDGPTIDEVD